jgi:hypothetical protein
VATRWRSITVTSIWPSSSIDRKLTFGVVGVLIVAALLFLGVGEADAEPPVVVGVLTDGGTVCVMLDADGNPTVFTGDIHTVVTPGSPQTDSDNVRCRATVANETGRAIKLTAEDLDVQCGIGVMRGPDFQATGNWHQTISASGKATLRCHD